MVADSVNGAAMGRRGRAATMKISPHVRLGRNPAFQVTQVYDRLPSHLRL
jgi:hypothetical protein